MRKNSYGFPGKSPHVSPTHICFTSFFSFPPLRCSNSCFFFHASACLLFVILFCQKDKPGEKKTPWDKEIMQAPFVKGPACCCTGVAGPGHLKVTIYYEKKTANCVVSRWSETRPCENTHTTYYIDSWFIVFFAQIPAPRLGSEKKGLDLRPFVKAWVSQPALGTACLLSRLQRPFCQGPFFHTGNENLLSRLSRLAFCQNFTWCHVIWAVHQLQLGDPCRSLLPRNVASCGFWWGSAGNSSHGTPTEPLHHHRWSGHSPASGRPQACHLCLPSPLWSTGHPTPQARQWPPA